MRLWNEHLKLGKGSVFVKRDLRILPLTDAEFEADFFLDRRFSTKRREAWRGMVVEREFGALLAMEDVQWPPPTVNDLATLLARAMARPPHFEDRQRPRIIHLQDRPQWHELLPHLRQLGIEVVLGDDLPRFDEAVVEWMQEDAASHEPLAVDKIKEDLKSPFPKRKRTSLDATLDLLRCTDETLSPKDQDDRVRMAFGLTSNDPLPDVDDETLEKYHEHLSKNLVFPFEAEHTSETGPFSSRTMQMKVIGLGDPDDEPMIDDTYGILCEARHERRVVTLPLGELEVKKGKPNRQLVEDYSYWFWNYR